MRKYFTIISIALVALFSNSCKVLFPNAMFRSSDEYVVSTDSLAQTGMSGVEYRITGGDIVHVNIYSIKGYILIDVGTGTGLEGQYVQQQTLEYLVQNNGYLKLPIIDSIYVAGNTIKETERLLEVAYSVYFKEPYVVVKVTNRRVLVFMGNRGAMVIPILNENTNLIEVLAMAGGLPSGVKAHKIKIIRGNLHDPIILNIDLSTINGMKEADLTIQANDIIYIEPVQNITTGLVSEFGPYASAISSILFIIGTIIYIQSL
ncbi:MAG: polysaccharide biosynthesis/export family protein [Bacteroidetes bacterium]|nr:polysaccharide biosynthesis/export family protein [Bacteroidota bacterium]